MAQACSNTEHRSRAGAVLRRVAAYAGVTLATVGLVTAFAAAPAEAAELDYEAASASEIQDHLGDLESERDDAGAELAGLQAQLEAAQAVVSAAAAQYGASDVQLTDVTAAVESADDELGAKVSTLVAYAQEQSDKYTEAQEAAELSDRLETQIDKTEAQVAGLDAQIEEARAAYDEAAEAEAAAAAAAEAAAAQEAEESAAGADSGGGGGSPSDSAAEYSSDAATAAVQFARDQLGESYVFGAAGPDTWDCSGLISGAYGVSGVSLTHSTWAMWDETSAIGRDDLRPGDLVFYNGQNHVAMYLGDGQVVHAPKPGDVVKISDLDMGMSIDGYRRV